MKIKFLLLLLVKVITGYPGTYGQLGTFKNLGEWFQKIKAHVGEVAGKGLEASWHQATNGRWTKKVHIKPQYIQSMGDVTYNGVKDKDGKYIKTSQTLVTFRPYEAAPTQLLDVGPTSPPTTKGPVTIPPIGPFPSDIDGIEATLLGDDKVDAIPSLYDSLVGSDSSSTVEVTFKLVFNVGLVFLEKTVYYYQQQYLEEIIRDSNAFDSLKLAKFESIEIIGSTYTELRVTSGPTSSRKAMNTNLKLTLSSGLFPDGTTFTVFDDATNAHLLAEITAAINAFQAAEVNYFDDSSRVTQSDLNIVDENQSIEETEQSLDHSCLSDECWYFDVNTMECQMRPEAAGHCYDLYCAHDGVQIKFHESFFGIQAGDAFPFLSSDDECYPVWNNETALWEWNTGLGDCGMEFGRLSTTAHIGFNLTFGTSSQRSYIESDELITRRSDGQVKFECTYVTSIALAADETGSQAHGLPAQSGHSLAHGFSIELHTDTTFEGMKLNKVKMGAPIFVAVKWGVSSALAERVRFYVRDCRVVNGETSLAIVENNCYSEMVGAALISESHIVATSSSFKYNTFSFTDSAGGGQKLECSVELCLLGEDCINRRCNLNSYMRWSLFGKRD